MPPDSTSPRIAAIVLGASNWPEWPELDNEAFEHSHAGFAQYLREVLKLDESRVLDLFNSRESPGELVRQMQDFLKQPGIMASDVVVYYVGHGDVIPGTDDFALLTACASKDHPDSSGFHASFLFEATRQANARTRAHLIVDACFSAAATAAFGKPMSSSGVAVLASASSADKSYAPNRSQATKFTTALLSVLRRGEPEGLRTLSLSSLRDLVEDELQALDVEDFTRPELHSPHQRKGNAATVGIFPNLAYGYTRVSRTGIEQSWCAVVSTADASVGRGGEFRDSVDIFIDRFRLRIERDTGWRLTPRPTIIEADAVFESARKFQESTAAVCGADLAFFDLTHFEPAVCVLLGIRAVIRRGVTICSTSRGSRGKSPYAAPFLLRDVNVVEHGSTPGASTRPDERAEVVFGRRALTGIRQLLRTPRTYSDLPAFDAMRQPGEDDDGKTIRPFFESVLVLCPFSDSYSSRNWEEVSRRLPGAILQRLTPDDDGRADPPDPAVERTLDMGSPQVVSTNLFRAMRLNDLCICDLTEWRPNVLFELGLRLAANPLHPLCIIDATAATTDDETERGLPSLRQTRDLESVFEFLHYEPRQLQSYYRMVDRHIQMRDAFRARRARTWSSDALPVGGVYRIAWQYADRTHEPNGVSVLDYLVEPTRALQQKSRGSSPFVFPVAHELSTLAQAGATERLVAAWLYAKHRLANSGFDGLPGDLLEQLTEIGYQLSERLIESDNPLDLELSDQIADDLDRLKEASADES
jgi:Caspase domain